MFSYSCHKLRVINLVSRFRSSCSMQLFNEFDAVIIDEASEANSSTTRICKYWSTFLSFFLIFIFKAKKLKVDASSSYGIFP